MHAKRLLPPPVENWEAEAEALLAAARAAPGAEEPPVLATETTEATTETALPLPSSLVGGRYVVGACLGTGGFGAIHEAEDTKHRRRVAVKFEPAATKTQQLVFEARAYREVAGVGTAAANHFQGVPRNYEYGTEGGYNFLVMERLGHSLETLKRRCGGRFSVKTTFMLGDQMLTRLERVHACGYVHRDIKPDNFLMGLGRFSPALYIVDFGLAKPFLKPDGTHVPLTKSTHNAGTVRYCSINMQEGWVQSRRDDLEAVAHVLLYLANGRLPWQSKGKDLSQKERDALVLRTKKTMPPEEVVGSGPPVLGEFLAYTRALLFDEKPDYAAWRKAFRAAAEKATGIPVDRVYSDMVYDWTPAVSRDGATMLRERRK